MEVLLSFMKLEFERNIPAFKGKSWFERVALRRQAQYKDPRIFWISGLVGILTFASVFLFMEWFVPRFHLSLAVFCLLYFVLAFPIIILLRALLVTPRIRRALDSDMN
jgi:hypothetical protein